MQTKWSYNSILSDKARGARVQKMFGAAVILALLVTFLPSTGVFAAPVSDDGPTDYGNQDLEWKTKLETLRFENVFYIQVKVFPSDYKDPDDLARAYELLNKFGSALKAANAVATTHDGFDEKGNVINEEKAAQSISDLGLQLHTMRGIRAKIEEEGIKIRKSK